MALFWILIILARTLWLLIASPDLLCESEVLELSLRNRKVRMIIFEFLYYYNFCRAHRAVSWYLDTLGQGFKFMAVRGVRQYSKANGAILCSAFPQSSFPPGLFFPVLKRPRMAAGSTSQGYPSKIAAGETRRLRDWYIVTLNSNMRKRKPITGTFK